MQAEVISIGDELTSGQRLNTNSQWLSQQLGDLGIVTIRHTTVGDDLQGNIDALQLATHRADIVICSGGLGPTLDDLTRQAMAEAFDRPLELDLPSLTHIESMFASRGREMPERNRAQALFPSGSQIIPNPHGSAPGIDLQVTVAGGKPSRVFALPGVPAEMKQMWRESVAPRIEMAQAAPAGRWRFHSIKLFGIGESDVEVLLPDLIHRERLPTVGITVSRATITLRIAARAHSDEEFASQIEPTVAQIRSALGQYIFGEGEDELQHVVLRELERRKLNLATVEVGAASWLSGWMLRAAEAQQDRYCGGIAFPDLDSARRWLENATPPSRADARPAVDAEVWETMARQLRERFHADLGLAMGIYPSQAAMERASQPFECVFAVATHQGQFVTRRQMGGHPDVLGQRIAKTGLDCLRRHLGGSSRNSSNVG